MIALAFLAVAFLLLRMTVILVNLITRPLLVSNAATVSPLLSVLIPARDEEQNIGPLLDDLASQDYRNLEILVYDDESTDGTCALVEQRARADSRIRLVRGSELPAGWLGKNHACHRLAETARGQYLLFLDADVRLKPGLISSTLGILLARDLKLLSVFPVQVMKTFGEKITVPLINFVLLSLLPLWLIGKTRIPALSAANGQFMLFDARTYKTNWPHNLVRNSKVEDIHIIRQFKKLGFRCQTLLSDGQISCRMYQGYGEAVMGFAKNFNAFFANSWLLLIIFALLSTFGIFFVMLVFPLWASLVYAAGIVSMKLIINLMSRQRNFPDIIYIPFQQFSLWLIIVVGVYKYLSRSLIWKGRPINIL